VIFGVFKTKRQAERGIKARSRGYSKRPDYLRNFAALNAKMTQSKGKVGMKFLFLKPFIDYFDKI